MFFGLRYAVVSMLQQFPFPLLSDEQRQAIEESGYPLALLDEETEDTYMLMNVDVDPDPLGGFSARIAGIEAYGSGDTVDEATIALQVSLGKVLRSI